jgi:IS605 OrfB family transposase
LNHLCRHKFVQRYVIPDRTIIPEPFEGCRKALEDARADRAKQIAHAIFASALGVELDHPPADKSGRRRRESLHGVYRCAERDPVNFIAIERLGNFRTSDRKSRRENRQLAEWRHREIHKVLKELCESVGLPIIEVDPAFTSRFSAKDHSVGFRAEEVFANDPRLPVWKRRAQTEPTWRVFISDLGRLPESKSLLLPKKGGPVFVSLAGLIAPHEKEPTHPADLSAAYRIGLRALAHPDRRELFGTVQLAIKANDNSSAGKNRCFIIDVSGSLPGSQKRLDCPWSVAPNSEFLWEEINGSMAWTRCTQINAARLAKWRRDATVPGHPEL